MPYPELYNWDTCAQFVSDFLTMVPLVDPLKPVSATSWLRGLSPAGLIGVWATGTQASSSLLDPCRERHREATTGLRVHSKAGPPHLVESASVSLFFFISGGTKELGIASCL